MDQPTPSVSDRIKALADALGLTLAQFDLLHPHGPDAHDGFPGVLVTHETALTFKERLEREKEAEGWRRV